MKTRFTWLNIAAVLVLASLLVLSCQINVGGDEKTDGNGSESGDIDWTSYNTAGTYAIRIKNESNRDLVAFMSSLSKDKILGGIPKNSGNHGIKLNTTLFNENKDFSIIFLTKEDYETYKSNLASREQYPFTRIFAMYNASGTNEVPFIVSGKLGGDNKLVINNMTSLNMELRQDSPRGTTLGYAPYEANNTTLFIQDGSFQVFPVFKKYNKVRDEILTIYPRAADGLPVGDEMSFMDGKTITISAGDYTGNISMSSGAAFLVVKNSSKQGVTVYKGSEVQTTASGISTINSGEERTFTILMDDLGQGEYEESKELSGWRVVQIGTRNLDIETTTLSADYRYTVTVEGDWNASTQKISAPVPGSKKITADFGFSN
jgi:hypothetical protein